ncbi:MAG: hypothetical protein HYV07_07780 [Deltaproteobacteria bacterium]|nr:hypothetical protein [Deltaproteobacteria bacterium]
MAFVLEYCARIVDGWITDLEPTNLDELCDVVASKLALKVEQVRSDEELEALCDRYVREDEIAFIQVARDFDDATFGLTVRLSKPRHGFTHVAVIDCRGKKAHKRYFSIWHEIAHLLVQPQLELAFRRCRNEKEVDPTEKLMDIIAGKFAFHDKFYGKGLSEISLASLHQHREEHAPASSLQAAFGSAVAKMEEPVLFVVAAEASKVADRGRKDVEMDLRAVSVVQSKGARAKKLLIPKNMRVPTDSVIYSAFQGSFGDFDFPLRNDEDLSMWKSQGRSLAPLGISVECAFSADRVLVVIRPK